jgi:hypothetical protein
VSTALQSSLLIGPDAAAEAVASIHASTIASYVVGAVRVAGLTIQTGFDTSPEQLAAFFDALAAKVRDAHAAFLARQPETGDPT